MPGLIVPREERTIRTDRVPLPSLPQVATFAEATDRGGRPTSADQRSRTAVPLAVTMSMDRLPPPRCS